MSLFTHCAPLCGRFMQLFLQLLYVILRLFLVILCLFVVVLCFSMFPFIQPFCMSLKSFDWFSDKKYQHSVCLIGLLTNPSIYDTMWLIFSFIIFSAKSTPCKRNPQLQQKYVIFILHVYLTYKMPHYGFWARVLWPVSFSVFKLWLLIQQTLQCLAGISQPAEIILLTDYDTNSISMRLFKALFQFIFFPRSSDAPSNHSWPLKVEHMNVDLTDYKWLDKINIRMERVNHTVLARISTHHRLFISRVQIHNVARVFFWKILPLLELFGWDESSPEVAVSHTLGLPPCRVILGHDLQNVSPLKGKSSLLARRRLIFQWDVVKQGSHVHLGSKAKSTIAWYLLLYTNLDKASNLAVRT